MSTPTEAPAREAAEAAPAAELTYREAMAADDAVLLMGEDVGADGGVFKTNAGLLETFGAERVRTTPICENGFLGVALGMSLVGLRPIVEIMFADFLPTAGDAIVNQLPKYRYMSGGQTAVPVTIRSISGGTGRFGTQHSATGESWFMHLPGPPIASCEPRSGTTTRRSSTSTRACTLGRGRSIAARSPSWASRPCCARVET
jgi:pyruvate dehydrogenase E1 component beta subunit